MRYLIETDEDIVINTIQKFEEEGSLLMLNQYDKFERITKNLQEIKAGMELLKRDGYSREILEAFVRSKGVSKREFHAVFDAVNDFFRVVGLVK